MALVDRVSSEILKCRAAHKAHSAAATPESFLTTKMFRRYGSFQSNKNRKTVCKSTLETFCQTPCCCWVLCGDRMTFEPRLGTCNVPLTHRPLRLLITDSLQDQKASNSSTLALANSMKEPSALQPPSG